MSKSIISDKEIKTRLESLSSEISLLLYQIARDDSKYGLSKSLSAVNKLLSLEIKNIELK